MHDPMSQSQSCDSSHSFICRYQQQLRSNSGKYCATPPSSSEQYSAEAALVTTKTFVALSRSLRSEAASCVESRVYPAHMCRLATQCHAMVSYLHVASIYSMSEDVRCLERFKYKEKRRDLAGEVKRTEAV